MAELRKALTVNDNWIESFKAVVMELTLRYRGTHGENLTEQFITAVERELERYTAKPGIDDPTMEEVRAIATRAIARARAKGVRAFEPALGE
jgi:hypothetical protein